MKPLLRVQQCKVESENAKRSMVSRMQASYAHFHTFTYLTGMVHAGPVTCKSNLQPSSPGYGERFRIYAVLTIRIDLR